ncbi:MAG: hypothetical protein E7053_00695 [Lentisphaerae bacterium]|nr:hypothetical protein [Lentisphaerota bacterium]
MKKILLLASVSTLLIFTGCGYKFGSLNHPQLQSIAVAPVTNETLAYNASAVLRGLLCERFTTDGSMKLESDEAADCILYARVTEVTYQALDYGTAPDGDDSFLANEWRCKVTVEYSVILPGRGKPLIHNRVATGNADFITGPDLETSRRNAMRQALFAATKSIVSNITEGW